MSSTSTCNERLSPEAHTLLGVLARAGDAPAGCAPKLTPQEWDGVLALARLHGVAPLLQRALRTGCGFDALPRDVRARLEEERRSVALDNLRNYGEFRRIAHALGEQGIPVIALKGLHLAELLYRDISLRPMGDLDILVPESGVEATVIALQHLGFQPDRGVPSTYCIDLTHPGSGVLVEVHWALARSNEGYTPPLQEIWRRALPARLGEADALVMSPEYLLLYVCAHLAHHHLFAADLRALCDIACIIDSGPALDWSFVVDQGRSCDWGSGIAAALRLAGDCLDARVPPEALTAMGGDTLDPQLLDDALLQLAAFVGFSRELQFAPNLMGLRSHIGWRAKLATLRKRIFPPRAELAQIYGISNRSLLLDFHYAVRLWDLIRRYAPSARELKASGDKIAASNARKARLAARLNKV